MCVNCVINEEAGIIFAFRLKAEIVIIHYKKSRRKKNVLVTTDNDNGSKEIGTLFFFTGNNILDHWRQYHGMLFTKSISINSHLHYFGLAAGYFL